MKRIGMMMVLALAIVAAIAVAGHHEGEELIALDKEWGAAAQGQATVDAIKKIIADDVVAISGTGVGSKADMIEGAQADDAATGPYVADHFSVKMLSDDIAVMTHHAGDPDPPSSQQRLPRSGSERANVSSP
jgi:hypothetical protein